MYLSHTPPPLCHHFRVLALCNHMPVGLLTSAPKTALCREQRLSVTSLCLHCHGCKPSEQHLVDHSGRCRCPQLCEPAYPPLWRQHLHRRFIPLPVHREVLLDSCHLERCSHHLPDVTYHQLPQPAHTPTLLLWRHQLKPLLRWCEGLHGPVSHRIRPVIAPVMPVPHRPR